MKTSPFSFALIAAALLLCASPARAQHDVAGTYGGTKVRARDVVVISPGAPSNQSGCRTVINTMDQDIFVPWKSDNEWTKFLATVGDNNGTANSGDTANSGIQADSCCLPTHSSATQNLCGKNYPLGQRVAGTRKGDATSYGAEGDVFGPFDVYTSPTNKVTVTYVCSKGAWQNTQWINSCYVDGECGPFNGTSKTYAEIVAAKSPMDYCTGSGVSNLTSLNTGGYYGAGPWTWKCPGQKTAASCSAGFIDSPINAACGSSNGSMRNTAPPLDQGACRLGKPDNLRGKGPADDPWLWDCLGYYGGTNALNCKATQIVAKCGYYNTNPSLTFDLAKLPIGHTGVCNAGSKPINLTGDGSAINPWKWDCYYEPNNTIAKNCVAKYMPSGTCGSANNKYLPSAPNKNNCSAGAWYDRVGGIANAVTGSGPWSWVCMGYLGSVPCSAKKCTACTGTEEVAHTNPSVSAMVGQCPVQVTRSWTSVRTNQALQSDSTITWTDAFAGTLIMKEETSKDETKCQPCYTKTTAVKDTQVKVVAPTGCLDGGSLGTITAPTSVQVR